MLSYSFFRSDIQILLPAWAEQSNGDLCKLRRRSAFFDRTRKAGKRAVQNRNFVADSILCVLFFDSKCILRPSISDMGAAFPIGPTNFDLVGVLYIIAKQKINYDVYRIWYA